jgi:hypothetical protein
MPEYIPDVLEIDEFYDELMDKWMNGWIAMVTTICFLGSIHSNTLVTLQSGFVSLVDLDDDK